MNELIKQEMRGGWLGMPRPFELIDLLGIALGSYFIYEGVTGKGPQWITISLGAIMVYIHSRRFVYAPQTKAGLTNLLQQLDIKPDELNATYLASNQLNG